jgi:hypothetical protein
MRERLDARLEGLLRFGAARCRTSRASLMVYRGIGEDFKSGDPKADNVKRRNQWFLALHCWVLAVLLS